MTVRKISAKEFENAWKYERAFYENIGRKDSVIFLLKNHNEMIVCDDYAFNEKTQVINLFKNKSCIAILKINKLDLNLLHFQ